MSATVVQSEPRPSTPAPQAPRFERVAVTSVFGDPRSPRTWSGAPSNVISGLERLGISVEGIWPKLTRWQKLRLAAGQILAGYGRPITSEQIIRGRGAREIRARQLAAAVERLGVRHVLHLGTLDLPALDLLRGVKHYLYCDQTWALSMRYRPDRNSYTAKAVEEYERLERDSLRGLDHVFTFGAYVRDNIVEHYGVSPERVTTVGSGMGNVEPYFGPKEYGQAKLLFVAKHLFKAKGGALLVDAFLRAHRRRPDLTLTIVGDERSRHFVPSHTGIVFRAHLPWLELQQLYRTASLLTQPMLNDPWGQVYLEALVSRTPVLGLNRNGLPEITEGGRHGFLVDEADPQALADAILAAVENPRRLAEMGMSGQRHALNTYSWNRVAERIAYR
ncbi:MAG TPA: glycosyltransferase family 4 protein [Alphaproteobacteria bacterium]|nr:glycosyltransferase family 4 protein [Alphaproteobacteria bacterium]